jgi:mRNA interferase RelE/StbE
VRAALKRVASGGRADVKRLRGAQGNADLFRLRVGDYRIVFAVVGDEIRVTRIIHRSEGYDWL